MNDIFRRSEAERYSEEREFLRILANGYEDVAVSHGAEPYAPGEDARRFRAAKPKRVPTTDTERAIIASISSAPLSFGFVSNFLLYGDPVRYLSVREKVALWSLVKGGALKAVRTRPSNYWLVASGHHLRDRRRGARRRDCGCVMVHAHGRHRRAARDGGKTPGYSVRLRIAFTADRRGKPIAYRWSGHGYPGTPFAGRWIKMPLADARHFVAHGDADQVPYVRGSSSSSANDATRPRRHATSTRGGTQKFARVMREFRAGTLRTSAGKRVTSRLQAVAIALSEQRRADRRRK